MSLAGPVPETNTFKLTFPFKMFLFVCFECVCVSAFMCENLGIHVPQHPCEGLRTDLDVALLLPSCVRQGLLTAVCQAAWLISWQNLLSPPPSPIGALGLQTLVLPVNFYVGFGDLNSAPHVYATSPSHAKQLHPRPPAITAPFLYPNYSLTEGELLPPLARHLSSVAKT